MLQNLHYTDFAWRRDELKQVTVYCIRLIAFLPERDYVMSQFRLSSVCNVGSPYSVGWDFRQYF